MTLCLTHTSIQTLCLCLALSHGIWLCHRGVSSIRMVSCVSTMGKWWEKTMTEAGYALCSFEMNATYFFLWAAKACGLFGLKCPVGSHCLPGRRSAASSPALKDKAPLTWPVGCHRQTDVRAISSHGSVAILCHHSVHIFLEGFL